MRSTRLLHSTFHAKWTGRTIVAVAGLLMGSASASSTELIYTFAGGNDGEYLDTDLVTDSAGNLYGTSVQGGDFGSGTVFELSLSGGGVDSHGALQLPRRRRWRRALQRRHARFARQSLWHDGDRWQWIM